VVWSNTTTFTANSVVSPDGTTTADTLDDTSTTAKSNVQQTFTSVGATAYTGSVYLKQGTATDTSIVLWDGVTFYVASVNWAALTISGNAASGAKLEEIGNDWFRFSLTLTLAAGTSDFRIYPANSNSPVEATGSVYAWGTQVEELPFATSYIPTTTVAVTRAANDCEVTYENNGMDATQESTFMGDFTVDNIGVPTPNDRGMMGIKNEQYRYIRFALSGFGLGSSRIGGASNMGVYTSGQTFRWASVESGSSAQGYVNGALAGSIATQTVTVTGTRALVLGNTGHSSSSHLFGHVKNFRIYDRALTASEVNMA